MTSSSSPAGAAGSDGSGIDRVLADARARLPHRPGPEDVDGLLADGALVVDIRPETDRRVEGELPGAVVVDRNVLEWRLDPSSPHRIEAPSPDAPVVLVCNDGYASSLAAVSLQQLGLHKATDLDGGYRAWRRHRTAGTEPEPPAGEVVVMVARVPPSGIEAFNRYEDAVLPLLARHRGRLERRLRTPDGLVEVHVVRFASSAHLDAYRSDPERADRALLLARSDVSIEAWPMIEAEVSRAG